MVRNRQLIKLLNEYIQRGKEGSDSDSDRGRERMKACGKEGKERKGGREREGKKGKAGVRQEQWGGKRRRETLPVNGTAASILGETSKWHKYPREGHRLDSKSLWLSFACVIRIT